MVVETCQEWRGSSLTTEYLISPASREIAGIAVIGEKAGRHHCSGQRSD